MSLQRILITGASSGLGRALALEHAAQGDKVLLLARRLDRLKAVAAACRAAGAADVRVLKADVTRRRDLDAAARLAKKSWDGLDVLYANAGYGQSGRLEDLSLAQWRAQMAVNVEGAWQSVQACLPLLKASRGHIGLVASVAGYGGTSQTGAYAASKAALRVLGQVLDVELSAHGVSVSVINPGFFASEIRLKDKDGRHDPKAPEYMPTWILGDPAVLARKTRLAVAAGKRELIWPLHGKLTAFLLRHFPGLAQALAKQLSSVRERRKMEIQKR